MKNTILIISGFILISASLFAQGSTFVKGQYYKGYIFPKEYVAWGFPPEEKRYTPSKEDIDLVEKILRDSIGIDYVKLNQKIYKNPPINKRTLKKYVRQYLGYLTKNDEIVIWINFLYKNKYIDKGNSKDVDRIDSEIIMVLDGGYYFWHICINLTTKKLSGMTVNGIS